MRRRSTTSILFENHRSAGRRAQAAGSIIQAMPDVPDPQDTASASPTGKRPCFLISPIGEAGSGERRAADQVLRYLVREALERHGFFVRRGDHDPNPGLITPRLLTLLAGADLVVADLSTLNPNVFYELAIAHGLRKPVVHLQRMSEPVPFDVRDLRIIKYDLGDLDSVTEARAQLERYALHALEDPTSVETPLSSANRFLSIQASEDPLAQSQAEVSVALGDLRTQIRSTQNGLMTALKELSADFQEALSSGNGAEMTRVLEPARVLGIRRISPEGGGGEEMGELLAAASHIEIMSTSAVRLLEFQKRSIVAALANGCYLRLLLPDPQSGFVKDVEQIESLEVPRGASLANEIDMTRLRVLEALAEASGTNGEGRAVGRVEIGYFMTHLRSTLILCSDSWGWLTLTLPPLRAVETASLELSAAGPRSLLGACMKHFDAVWSIARVEPLEPPHHGTR